MANSFPGSGLAYADAFSVGTANAANSSLYVCSSCVQATRIEHTYSQTNLHHNTLWLRAMNTGAKAAASIGFTVVNDGGDHHRANIEATANAGQLGGNLALYTRNNSGPDVLGLYINHTGNVGINTTSPSEKFHVNGTSQFDDGLNMTRGKISWGGSPSRFIVTSCGGYNMVLGTDDFTDRMTIQASTGNVGIGTNDPITKLHVEQSTSGEVGRFRANVAGCADVVIVNNAQTWGFRVDNAASNAFHLRNFQNSTNIMTLTTGGSVGLGTTIPCTRLSVKCSTGSIKIDLLSLTTTDGAGSQPTMRFDTIEANCNVLGRISVCDIAPYAGTMIFETSGCKGAGSTITTELMRLVGTTGNVGINTTSPSYKLHVNGTFYAAGSSQDYKEGICQYNTDSCLFMCLKPKTYQYKDEWKHLGKDLKSETQIGLIAEEVAESHPELAILVNEEDNKVVRNVDYEKLSIILLSEVQKLRQEVDQLKNK
jgi:hypothetical protein